jgi:hypothetical protein
MTVTRGEATLVLGTVTVNHSRVPANAVVNMTPKTLAGTLGQLFYSITAGVSFTLRSNNPLDGSTISYTVTV